MFIALIDRNTKNVLQWTNTETGSVVVVYEPDWRPATDWSEEQISQLFKEQDAEPTNFSGNSDSGQGADLSSDSGETDISSNILSLP